MKPQTIFPRGNSYVVQFAAIIRDVVSLCHGQYIHQKATATQFSLHMRTRHAAGCKGVRAGNQEPDIKFVRP